MSSNRKKYRFHFYTEEGRPFSYYIEPISKEAYEYWNSNGGMDALYKHFRHMSSLDIYDLLKSDNAVDLQKLLDSEFPEIPNEARVLPRDPNSIHAESVYWYSSYLCGMIYHWNQRELQNYLIELHEISTETQEATLVWKGSLADLVQKNPNAIKGSTYTNRHESGFYSHFIQSEDAAIIGQIELTEKFDINKVFIKTSIDSFYGECINLSSFCYQNDEGGLDSITLDWDYYSSNLVPHSLHNGIDICESN